MNSIYLRRRCKVLIPEGTARQSLNYAATLQKKLEPLGFLLSAAAMERLQTLSVEELRRFSEDLELSLRKWLGAHQSLNAFYPNFPAQVMEMSEAELYFRAILHYITGWRPSFEKQERPPLDQAKAIRVIELGDNEDFLYLFTLLVGANSAWSIQDKEDIAWFVQQYAEAIFPHLPKDIPQKENLAFLGAKLLRRTADARPFLQEKLKTATDVLRLAVALSDGDVSLAQPGKFIRFPRRERRLLLGWLESCGQLTEDMLRWKERWKRLGERLHPGDYADTFQKTYAAFKVLWEDQPFERFSRTLELHLAAKDTPAAIALLKTRPGDLIRRLDHLGRLGADPKELVDTFAAVAARVSTPVLLQVFTHFRHRESPSPLRVFFPKGELAKVYGTNVPLPPFPAGLAEELSEICRAQLLARFAKLPTLGKCYLDPALKDYLVPFSQRSAAKSLRTLVRGSRAPLPDAAIIRFFLWWKNGKSRTDIDLSAVIYDADFKYLDVLSYYQLKSYGGCHSGDITDAPEGAAEFIDLDIERLLASKARYVVMSLNSYTEQPYCDLPECFAGWMARKSAGSGEIFEPRTVQDKIDVAADTRICLPAVFDLVSRQVIWADFALRANPRWNNVRNNLSGVSLMLRALTSLQKTDLATLFALHIEARGEAVSSPEAADSIFSVSSGLTPFDLDRISAEFLAN